MKEYIFELKIIEGSDEFWESLKGKPGCEEITEVVREALEMYGFHFEECGDTLTLKQYNNKE